jgi:hypothetical protein
MMPNKSWPQRVASDARAIAPDLAGIAIVIDHSPSLYARYVLRCC